MALFARCVIVIACVILITEGSSSDWLIRSVRSIHRRRQRRTHTNFISNKIVENYHHHNHHHDSPIRENRMTDCCYNGGICILNSFCHCPQGFHGRLCEHKTRDRSCGTIEHGTWIAKGCYLCHCFDGNMRCKTTRIPNCEYIPFVQAKEELPDYQVDVDKKFADYERFYDIVNEEVVNASTSGSGGAHPTYLRITKLLVVVFISALIGTFVS